MGVTSGSTFFEANRVSPWKNHAPDSNPSTYPKLSSNNNGDFYIPMRSSTHAVLPPITLFIRTKMSTGTRYTTLQHNLGYDMFWVVEKCAYSVDRNVIACVVTFRDLSELTSSLGCALCEPVHAVRMIFNLSTTKGRSKVRKMRP